MSKSMNICARALLFFGVAFGLLVFAPRDAGAEAKPNRQTISENLKQAREQLRHEEDRLNTLKKNQESLDADVKKSEAELSKIENERATLESDLAQIDTSVVTTGKELEKIQASIEARRGGRVERAVAVYKVQRRKNAVEYLLNAHSATDLLKRGRYLALVAEYDTNYLQALAKLSEALKSQQEKFQSLKDDKVARAARLVEVGKEFRAKREKLAMLASEQREKIDQQEKMLAKMRESADKLEQVLASIMGGEQPPAVTPEKTQTPESSVVNSGTTDVITTPFSGDGLAAVKGKLEFPVVGEILQKFGKQKHEEFTDIVFVKGVELRCLVGTKVRAVHRGRVVMSQVLPGYGNVVIVDHGQRYYTLYGRLATSLRSVGQEVTAGEELAVLGEPDYKGRNFYFELRVKGKATNPLEYFRKAPPVRTAAVAPS